jgi:hypothetical protein
LARKVLLKPRKAGGSAPVSAVYVPMLLTLALGRGGLEVYANDDDDGSDLSGFTTADIEDSHDSCNYDGQHSSASKDSELSTSNASEGASDHATKDSGDQSEAGSEETGAQQREQIDECNEEASTEQSD